MRIVVYGVVTPFLSTLRGIDVDNPFNKFWVPRTQSSAALLSATVYAASVNVDGIRQIPFQPQTLASKSRTIQLVNKGLEEAGGEVTDELICSVLVLMYTEVALFFCLIHSNKLTCDTIRAQWANCGCKRLI